MINKQRKIFHIDMNSFFASCEQAKNEDLREKKMAVAGDPAKRHGIILAASYEAKSAGVKTTMPIWHAQKICPELIICKCNMELYKEYSDAFMNILNEYAPVIEKASIDEAYLDLTGTEKLYPDLVELAKVIQNRIYDELLLKCSIGISENKLLAKMGSDYKKPMGITELYIKDVPSKMWGLKVDELFGIGRKSSEVLKSIGVYTIGDLARYDKNTLRHYFGEKSTEAMLNSANGYDDSEVIKNELIEAKSYGAEHTFSEDINDIEVLYAMLLKFSENIAFKLRANHKKSKTIMIKIKYANFTYVTKNFTLNEYTNITNVIYENSKMLLEKSINKLQKVRLVGLSCTNFIDEKEDFKQLTIFELDDKKEDNQKKEKLLKLDNVIDKIKQKYGSNIIIRAKNIKIGEKNE